MMLNFFLIIMIIYFVTAKKLALLKLENYQEQKR